MIKSSFTLNSESLQEALSLRPSGSAGWYEGKCPVCNRRKLSFRFFADGLFFKCWRVSCNIRGTSKDLSNLLGGSISVKKGYVSPITKKRVLPVERPVFFERIFSHPYLDGRGFRFYKKYCVGVTPRYDGYLIFMIEQGGKEVGWLGRSYLGADRKYLNASGISFGKMLFGIDDIVAGDEVFLVEGIFDKFALDALGVKSVAVFGSSISSDQCLLLLKAGVKKVVIAFDEDVGYDVGSTFQSLELIFDVSLITISGGDIGSTAPDLLKEKLKSRESFLKLAPRKLEI